MPDTALHPYHFRQRVRRRGVWSAIAACGAGLAVALMLDLAPPLLLVLLFAFAALAILLGSSPEHGISITAQHVTLYGAGRPDRIPIARLSHASFAPGPTGEEQVTLHMRDGTTTTIPPRHLPTAEVLRHEFRRAGIAVRET